MANFIDPSNRGQTIKDNNDLHYRTLTKIKDATNG